MLGLLKNVIQGKLQPKKSFKPAVIKIKCVDFDSIEQTINVSNDHLSNSNLSFKCPICFESVYVSVFSVDNEYIQFDQHAIKKESGDLLPERI